MTGNEIAEKFYLQIDDSSELSTQETLDLANDIYNQVCDDRDWEWLKKTASDVTSVSVDYITLPTDFKKILPNKDDKSIVFVGTDYQEYVVVPFSSRRDYRNEDGFCYIDIPNRRLVFTLQPTSVKTVEYDYIKIQDDLTSSTSPLFRSAHHKVIAYGMAANFNVIEQTDKSTSYRKENLALYESTLSDMRYEDAAIKLSI